MLLSWKRKIFSDFFLNFVNLSSIYNIFKKNMTHIADILLILRTPKHVVR